MPSSRPDSKGDLELLREVSDDELREAREANALLNRLASATPYARLVELYDALVETLGREASPERRAAELNRAARALAKVATELPDDLRRSATADFGDGSDGARELEAAIGEETQRTPFRLLVAVGNLERGPFAVVDGALANDAEAVEALAADVPEVRPNANLVLALGGGVVVAQRLIGRQLQIYEPRIDEASLYLRRLAAEVADGAPALMHAESFDPDAGETSFGQTTFDPLALDKALYLHRALRRSRQLLADTEGRVAGADQQGEEVGEHAAVDPAGTRDHEATTPGAGADAVDGATEAPSPDVDEAAPEPPPGDRQDQVLDLRSLAQHATEFVDELEKAWSAALDAVVLAEAQEEMNARYSSLLRSIARRASAGDRALRAAGLDPRVPALPLAPEEIARLTLDPDPERRWRQLQLAEVDALILVLEALEGLRQPSAQTIYFDENRVETWWEAGAFALVRDRTALLVRVSEQLALAEAAVAEATGVEQTAANQPQAFFERLRLASDALGHGDSEGALLHARLALRLRAALEVDPVPDDLLERLASDARLVDEAPLLRLLDDAAAKLARGEALDIGAAMVAAPRALAVVGRLCLETPQIITAALSGGGDAGD